MTEIILITLEFDNFRQVIFYNIVDLIELCSISNTPNKI